MGQTIESLCTPAVVVDLDIVHNNITAMGKRAKEVGIKHRPHIKTHKSVYLAKLQQDAGCIGITCAKLGEAEVFAEAGFDDILIAYPIIGEDKLARLERLGEQIHITVCADSVEAASGVSDVGDRLNKRIPLLIEVDGGIHRCGRQPGEDTLEFAKSIKHLSGIEIVGILSYAGQIYDDATADVMRQTAHEEAQTLIQTAQLLKENGFAISIISAGSSLSTKFMQELKGVTEVRAGNYIFHDQAQLSTGMVSPEDCALRVITTVISASQPGRAVIDAGSKTLTTDTAHYSTGYGYVLEHPEIEIYKLNEEHGYLRFDPSLNLKIGDRLTIIPNHACVIPNLCDEIVGVRGRDVMEPIKIDARGKNN